MSAYILVPVSKDKVLAKISIADADLVEYLWFVWNSPSGKIYPRRNLPAPKGKRHGKSLYLHIEIAQRMFGEVMDGLDIDHINRDPLDCRRDNLRLVTRGFNIHNRESRRGSTEFKGVYKRESGTWRAICGDQTTGNLATPEEAALAYDRLAIIVFGPTATTNQSLGLIPNDDGRSLKFVDARRKPRGKYRSNKSGFVGVCQRIDNGSYRAKINRNGKTIWSKSGFDTSESASRARLERLSQFGMEQRRI
mgnify:CR=1 FL=1